MDKEKVLYRGWRVVAIGGLCSSFICFVSFKGSFIDSLVVFPLGCLLVAAQQWCSRNELYSNVFEIAIATLLSFICAALAATHKFCYTAIASSSVVLILPGAIVLSGSLELASKNIISGSVRMMYAVMYSVSPLAVFIYPSLTLPSPALPRLRIGNRRADLYRTHAPSSTRFRRLRMLRIALLRSTMVPSQSLRILGLPLRTHVLALPLPPQSSAPIQKGDADHYSYKLCRMDS